VKACLLLEATLTVFVCTRWRAISNNDTMCSMDSADELGKGRTRMTAWIVNPFDNLPLEGNRPQRYWLMARAFAAAGWNVRLWTSDFSHATKKKRVLLSAPDEFPVELLKTLPYGSNVCWRRIRSHRALARTFSARAREVIAAGEPPDLIVSSTPPLGLCSAAQTVAGSCGAKFVCDIQDAWPETFARLLPRAVRGLEKLVFAGMYRTARKIYREADGVTGVCRRYAELSGRPDFYLAHHGIEGNGEPGTANGDVRRGVSRLVYVGNLGVGYDLNTVIEAVAKRPDLTLDIAGLGPREGALHEAVRRLGVGSRVRFHGYLGADALKALMATCDVGVIPMRDDSWVGLPYKLADYLRARLLVVSSLHGECGDLLERTGYGRTYEWQSVESLLAALASLTPACVTLPDELRAESIYPKYVQRVSALNETLVVEGLRLRGSAALPSV